MTLHHTPLTLSALILLSCTSPASAATIDFGDGAFQALPYVEDGLTFANLPGTSPAVIGSNGGDGQLVAGTNVTPIKVRVSGAQPFDLISLDVEQMFRNWRIESSAGAITAIPGVGALTLNGTPGWNNLSYFDLIHDPGEANGSIRVDNVVFEAVPEPNSLAIAAVSLLGILIRCKACHLRRLSRPQVREGDRR